jgi:DNA repair protein RecO (recombination protein O)
MIVKTEAVILKSMKYGESSRIVTLYTREFGKTSIIAKGARGPKPRFGAALDVLSRSDIVMYKKEHRDLHLLSQADLIQQYRGVIDHPERLMAAFAMLEFLHVCVHEEEGHEELYELLTGALEAMNDAAIEARIVLLRFLVGLASALGISVDVRHCITCRASLEHANALPVHAMFSPAKGGCTCAICVPPLDGIALRREAVALLQNLQAGRTHSTGQSTTLALEAVHVLNRYLASHIDGMRNVRSMRMLDAFE